MKSLLLCGLLAALPSFAVTIIADTSMHAIDYSLGQSGAGTVFGQSTGTNRFVTMQLLAPVFPNTSTSLSFEELNVTHTWDPSVNGAITSITFYLDIFRSPGSMLDQFAFIANQGGVNVAVAGFGPASNGTVTFDWTGSITSPGPVRFGYALSSLNAAFAPLTNVVTLDNFCVVVNENPTAPCAPSGPGGANMPEPGSLAMLGAAGVAFGLYRRRQRLL